MDIFEYLCQNSEVKIFLIDNFYLKKKGVRSVMLDFQEIPGSVGNSSLVMESKGHRIFFTIENLPGFVEIKKSGWTGFSYSCVINTEVINESKL